MAKKRRTVVTLPATQAQQRRNPFALSPLMRRGGVHEKSTGAKRRAGRMALQRLKLDNDD